MAAGVRYSTVGSLSVFAMAAFVFYSLCFCTGRPHDLISYTIIMPTALDCLRFLSRNISKRKYCSFQEPRAPDQVPGEQRVAMVAADRGDEHGVRGQEGWKAVGLRQQQLRAVRHR